MKKYQIKILDIIFEDAIFAIISTKNERFISNIIKGSVNFKIYNSLNKEINLNGLQKNEIIKIYGKMENNNIVIKKVCVCDKYVFYSDSSENSEDFKLIN
jgi:hypothetical protein